MPSLPSRAAYSYDGTWFLAKALDNVVKNHGVKLEKIQTGNETFYNLLTSTLGSITFTGLTVRTVDSAIINHDARVFLQCIQKYHVIK